MRNAPLIGSRGGKKQRGEQSRETSKDCDGFNVEEGCVEEAGERLGGYSVCGCVEGFNSCFPAVRPPAPLGFHRTRFYRGRGRRIGKEGAAVVWWWAREG